MKQSNWILGIGVIVAIILIAGALFLSSTNESTKSADEPVKRETSTQLLNIVIKPVKSLSAKILLNK